MIKKINPNPPNQVMECSQKLEYLCLVLVYIITKKKTVIDCQYCYFINKPYNRISEMNFFSEKLSPQDENILAVEISCHYESDIWKSSDEEIFSTCIQAIEKDNFLKKEDVTNLSKSSEDYILSILENSNYGFFQTHELNKYTIEYNMQGGAQWTGASVNPYNNVMYVTANNIAWKVGVQTYKKKSRFKYTDKKEEPLRDLEGYPGTKPPWGTLTAINLNTGKILWQSYLGYYESLKSKGIITGTENFGGATATSGGLVFAAGTLDKLIRAFDVETGKELWSHKLPFIGSAPPTSYEINGEQYIVLPASGGIILKMFYGDMVEQGDAVVAFKIQD